jgi:urea transporter
MGAPTAGNLTVALGAVVGLLVYTAMAILLTVDRAPLQQSLCGVNVILVGIAVPTLVNHPWSITR